MAKSVLTSHQVSMTEWFAAIGEVEESNTFRVEDNTKQQRLEYLKHAINLPFRTPQVFPAQEAFDLAPAFSEYLISQADTPCAFRLISEDLSLPKYRERGYTVQECYEKWFKKLDIDFSKYTLSIFPNETDIKWSTIFVINQEAIFGEIVQGVHSQLSQGEIQGANYYFKYDFQKWEVYPNDLDVVKEIQRTIEPLCVSKEAQPVLAEALDATFSHGYLCGYFETLVPPDWNFYFIDYNRVLPSYIATPTSVMSNSTDQAVVQGMAAFAGKASGKVVVVTHDNVDSVTFPEGSVLVCDNTDVRYLSFMKKAAAIVTDRGGMLSHAAIIARELQKPTLIGCGDATTKLRQGELVEVDTTCGMVRRV